MIDVIHFYKVSNLENVKKFYGEILGFSLYKDQGKCLIYDTIFGKIGFCIHFPEETSKSCITFVYETWEEVDNMYDKLKLSNIDILHKPDENKYFNIYHFFVKDLNGLTLEFQSFTEVQE